MPTARRPRLTTKTRQSSTYCSAQLMRAQLMRAQPRTPSARWRPNLRGALADNAAEKVRAWDPGRDHWHSKTTDASQIPLHTKPAPMATPHGMSPVMRGAPPSSRVDSWCKTGCGPFVNSGRMRHLARRFGIPLIKCCLFRRRACPAITAIGDPRRTAHRECHELLLAPFQAPAIATQSNSALT